MKRSTVIGHLREMAEAAQDRLGLRDSSIGWPLEELWAAGEILDGAETVDFGAVVLSFDLPAQEVPWLAVHPVAEWVGQDLRLGKRPFSWYYRPSVWPAWNPTVRRVLRVWSAKDGVEQDTLLALSGRSPGRRVVEPTAEVFAQQMQIEAMAARAHLAWILDHYWDRGWRSDHRGEHPPEDHLWRAAEALREISEALSG